MRTMGIKSGDFVLVIEHRGERQLVHNGLVMGFSMDEKQAGTRGQPMISACFGRLSESQHVPELIILELVHISRSINVRLLGPQELIDHDSVFSR